MIVGRRREELERVRGGFQLIEEERTERVSLIKYRLLKYIIPFLSQLDKMVGDFQKAFYLFIYFFLNELEGLLVNPKIQSSIHDTWDF